MEGDTGGAGSHCSVRTRLWMESVCQDQSECKCITESMYRHSLSDAGVWKETGDWLWLEQRQGERESVGKMRMMWMQ